MFESLRIASRSAALTLLAALLACVPFSLTTAATASQGDIVVVTVHGTVNATMAGMTVPLSAGAILQLPATVRTGTDGAVELRQGPSTFAAAGNTELEIPQSAAQDGLIERIIQIRGNAFYSIGKRTGTRLRVEAPYLVAVIKGTQFNVAAQADSTTIALFEGHLEVRASDDSDVVDLDAGEIAIRRRNDVSISVLRLNAARGDTRRNPELAARKQADSSNSNASAVVARSDNTAARPRLDTPTSTDDTAAGGVVTTPERGRVDAIADTTTNVTAKAAIEVAARDNTPVSANVDVDAKVAGTGVDAGATTTVDVAGVSANAGASAAVDVPAGSVDVNVGGGAAVGGAASVDTSVSAGADLSAGTVAASGDVGVAAGPVSADVGTTAAVDVPAGTADVGVDTSVASTNVGATVGVDAGTGNVGTDVGVAGVNVGVDVGTSGVGLDAGSDNSGGLLGGLGGLLGGRKRN